MFATPCRRNARPSPQALPWRVLSGLLREGVVYDVLNRFTGLGR